MPHVYRTGESNPRPGVDINVALTSVSRPSINNHTYFEKKIILKIQNCYCDVFKINYLYERVIGIFKLFPSFDYANKRNIVKVFLPTFGRGKITSTIYIIVKRYAANDNISILTYNVFPKGWTPLL